MHLDDPKVSRRHGELEPRSGGWVYRDVGSRNGTFQDARRVSELLITDGVRLRLGGQNDGVVVELTPAELPATDSTGPGPRPSGPTGAAEEPPRKLAVGARTRIGRTGENDLVLSDDLRVSRHHAELVREGAAFEIVDVGSSNGTFVNGQRVQRARLAEGDLLTVGNHVFRFADEALAELPPADQASFQAVSLQVRTDEGRPILQDVSFYLEPSQLLAVVGPSGSGKTTLLNALTGFRPAQTGSVLFGGRDLYASFEDLRQRIGFVPQDDILHPQLSIRRALEYAAELRFPPDVDARTRGQRVEEVMGELDLTQRADLPIAKLSGGQRKRVSVALELLTRPSLLFLDEPTSGLDPGNERQVMGLLRELATGGRTVIVVTHSTQSLHLCDRVLFLAPGGRMAFYGPPNEALEYFNRHGAGRFYADIFTGLEGRLQTDWPGQLKADPAYDKYVQRPLEVDAAVRSARPPQSLPPPRPQPWSRQFSVLTRRYMSLIRSDRGYLLLLLLQAPILGLILAVVFNPGDETSRLSPDHPLEATTLALSLVLGITWVAMLNSIREIVKEFPVYRRERSVGLSISAYVASKAAVLGVITVIQAVVLVAIALKPQLPLNRYEYLDDLTTQTLSPHGSLLASPLVEVMIGVALTGLAAMGLGLLVSAVASNADKALTIVPILIIPQLVLAGGLFPTSAPVIGQLKFVAGAQWGMSAVASTLDMSNVKGRAVVLATLGSHMSECSSQDPAEQATCQQAFEEGFARNQVSEWKHSGKAWAWDALWLLGLTVLALAGAYFTLKRRDAHVFTTGPIRAGPLANLLAGFKSFGARAKT